MGARRDGSGWGIPQIRHYLDKKRLILFPGNTRAVLSPPPRNYLKDTLQKKIIFQVFDFSKVITTVQLGLFFSFTKVLEEKATRSQQLACPACMLLELCLVIPGHGRGKLLQAFSTRTF